MATTNTLHVQTLLILNILINPTLTYQFNSNSGATVHGAKARNSSIPLRSVLANQQPQSQEPQCDYCQPKECLSDEEEDEFVFCYVEKDKENDEFGSQMCAKSEMALRRLVAANLEDIQEMESGCLQSKRSAFLQICWCQSENGDENLKSLPEETHLTDRNRIRFNSGRRGGLQVVRLQSAEDMRSNGETLLRPRNRIDSLSSTNLSALDTAGSATSNIQRPVIHTIPRRPSPANNKGVGRERQVMLVIVGLILTLY